jgi:hypothetical protein
VACGSSSSAPSRSAEVEQFGDAAALRSPATSLLTQANRRLVKELGDQAAGDHVDQVALVVVEARQLAA